VELAYIYKFITNIASQLNEMEIRLHPHTCSSW